MQKTNSKLWVRFVPLLMVLGLVMAACGGTENNDFSVLVTPSATSVEVGTAVTLTASAPDATGTLTYEWEVDGPGSATITSTTETAILTPDAAGEYEISVTVTDTEGNEGEGSTTVDATSTDDGDNGGDTGGNTGGGDTGGGDTGGGDTGGEPPVVGEDPTLDFFGVAAEQGSSDDDYLNDSSDADPPVGISSEDDDRVLDATPATTIFARITASDADGVTSLGIQIRNLAPESGTSNRVATLTQGSDVDGFTLQAPVGTCDLSGSQTTVTCTYPIDVAASANEDNLNSGEFAYVLRPTANDFSNFSALGSRGYINTATTASSTSN